MKPLFFLTGLFVLGGALTAEPDLGQEVRRLDLTEAQITAVVQVIRDTRPELLKAQAESRVVQANLARLLLEDAPGKAQIDKLLREGLEWDLKAKALRIDRSLKIRAIVGKDRWAGLSHLSLRALEAEKSGKKLPKSDEKGALKELLGLLRDLN